MIVRELNDSFAVLKCSVDGIAFEIAAQLAEAGVPKVVLNGRSKERGEAAVEQLLERAPNCEIYFILADVSEPGEARRFIQEALDKVGRIDILVNSIGGGVAPTPFHTFVPDNFMLLIKRHQLSVLECTRAAMPAMVEQEGGVIINIASDAAKVATPGESVIGMMKAGVLMFSRTLALEASRSGIRVHCITPSIVADTPRYNTIMANEFSGRLFRKAESKARLGVVTPKDIAPVCVFLASPQASKITGQGISVNGGISAA